MTYCMNDKYEDIYSDSSADKPKEEVINNTAKAEKITFPENSETNNINNTGDKFPHKTDDNMDKPVPSMEHTEPAPGSVSPINHPDEKQVSPDNQSESVPVPPVNQPGPANVPPINQLGGAPISPANQPGPANVPPINQPGGAPTPVNHPGPANVPPINQPSGAPTPVNQPGPANVPPINQPGGAPTPVNQPGYGQTPPSQYTPYGYYSYQNYQYPPQPTPPAPPVPPVSPAGQPHKPPKNKNNRVTKTIVWALSIVIGLVILGFAVYGVISLIGDATSSSAQLPSASQSEPSQSPNNPQQPDNGQNQPDTSSGLPDTPNELPQFGQGGTIEPTPNPSNLRFGIVVSAVTDQMSQMFNVPKGLIIREISDDSSLKGQVELYDIITQVNGQDITDTQQLYDILNNGNEGDTVEFTIARISDNEDGIQTFKVNATMLANNTDTQTSNDNSVSMPTA